MNKKFQNVNDYALRKEIYESVMRNIVANLNESEMNELFGFGSGASKPTQELSSDYIKSASSEELANTVGEHLNYWAESMKDGLDKAVNTAIQTCLSITSSGKDNSKKFLQGIVSAVRNGINGTLDIAKKGAKALPRIILLGIALTVKLAYNGVEFAKEAITAMYRALANACTTGYQKLEKAAKNVKDFASDAWTAFAMCTHGAYMLLAYKVQGAKEYLENWVSDVVKAAKEKSTVAVLMVRSWFAIKANEAKETLTKLVGDAKNAIVEAYNAIDKNIRKQWSKLTEKLIEWCNAVSLTASKLADKVKETMTAAGDAIISGKDKMMVAGINKAVKMLSNKYSEDDVVAMVRKAYNEGLTFDAKGRCIINEAYYRNTILRRI